MRTIFGRSAGLRASAAVGRPRQIPVTTSSASRIGLEKCIGGRLKRLAKRGQFFQQIAKRLAKGESLEIDYRVGDFLDNAPHQAFDLVFEHTLFCAIPPARRGDYAKALRGWLKPGGYYLAVNYMITEDNGEPPFSTTETELDQWFGGSFELLRRWTPRSYESRTGKELMNEWKMKS